MPGSKLPPVSPASTNPGTNIPHCRPLNPVARTPKKHISYPLTPSITDRSCPTQPSNPSTTSPNSTAATASGNACTPAPRRNTAVMGLAGYSQSGLWVLGRRDEGRG
ncbi:hypothetical protein EJ03DRAFT_327484 [Teratosphaeria nubilosa]|uniref:Uncharacterized protein n=1 Tax=Teratosphaeria nubilosa TaxID=161662 RepID=A0A6G1L9V7_9PEZI|nr:hypothetical protein EJ03DRAFT_327484 [Teratosphaeria nubilosa]